MQTNICLQIPWLNMFVGSMEFLIWFYISDIKDWEYKKELTKEEIKIKGEQVVIMVDRFPFSSLGETSTSDVQIDVKLENTEFLGNVWYSRLNIQNLLKKSFRFS